MFRKLMREKLRRVRSLEIRSQVRGLYHNVPYHVRGVSDGLPIPPWKLRCYTWPITTDLRFYFQDRMETAQNLLDTLTRHGADTDELRAILDFGCGNGRVIRQFHSLKTPLKKAKLYGTDINPEQIDWCRRNLPFAEFEVNRAQPPLNYSDEKFAFIYNFSVFTHLSEPQQFLWINELSRVLRPAGHLFLTTCGESYVKELAQKEKEQFRAGHLVVRGGELAGSPSTYGGCAAYHPVDYVKEKLAKGFELVEFVPDDESVTDGMDAYLLRKPINAGLR